MDFSLSGLFVFFFFNTRGEKRFADDLWRTIHFIRRYDKSDVCYEFEISRCHFHFSSHRRCFFFFFLFCTHAMKFPEYFVCFCFFFFFYRTIYILRAVKDFRIFFLCKFVFFLFWCVIINFENFKLHTRHLSAVSCRARFIRPLCRPCVYINHFTNTRSLKKLRTLHGK